MRVSSGERLAGISYSTPMGKTVPQPLRVTVATWSGTTIWTRLVVLLKASRTAASVPWVSATQSK